MEQTPIDLKKEQQATIARPHYKHSLAARFFFGAMDLAAGRKTTLAKVKLLEMLASVPYRAWEIRQYARMTRGYRNQELVLQARQIVNWGREAQDNEYWHLLVVNEKMKEDRVKDSWYLFPPISYLIILSYVFIARTVALFSIRRAFKFNAEFEDHAEHTYAQFVADHPEWEEQPVTNALVKEYGDLKTWADVFRRIGLDERDHMNSSFAFCGEPEHIVQYNGMPGKDYSIPAE
jgi:ubiquinol oxidase